MVYLLDKDSQLLKVIDGQTDKIVANFSVSSSKEGGARSPLNLVVDSRRNIVYVASGELQTAQSGVIVIVPLYNSSSSPCIAYGHRPDNLRTRRQTTLLLCAIDGNTNRVIGSVTINSPRSGGDLAIDPNKDMLYVINATGTISALSGVNQII